MPDIVVEQPHALGAARAREAADALAATLHAQLGAATHWEGDRLHFERRGARGARGHADVSAEAVRVEVRLGRMLKPVKGRIRAEIERVLAAKLG